MSRLRLLLLPLGFAVGAVTVAAAPGELLFRGSQADVSAAPAPEGRWACPMFCTITDHPGKCPVCGMDLEPLEDHGNRVPLTRNERRMIGLEAPGPIR